MGNDDRIARRNVALVKMIYTAGLRRNEAVSLDYPDDVSLERGTIKVLGKGKTDKVELTLPDTAIESLKEWLSVRGEESGPLFNNFDPVGERRWEALWKIGSPNRQGSRRGSGIA